MSDVLSFALEDDSDDSPILLDPELAAQIPENLGDLFISIDKVGEQAKFLGHSNDRELGFLIVHGFLHLNGYDHEEKADEEKIHRKQENNYLQRHHYYVKWKIHLLTSPLFSILPLCQILPFTCRPD